MGDWKHIDSGLLLSKSIGHTCVDRSSNIPDNVIDKVAELMDQPIHIAISPQRLLKQKSILVEPQSLAPDSVVSKLLDQGYSVIK